MVTTRPHFANIFYKAVTSINDAPILSDFTPAITINEDDASNEITIDTLLQTNKVDETADQVTPGDNTDNTEFDAIAITGTSIVNGTLQFSTDGTNFTNITAAGALSASSALLLEPDDKLRFVATDAHFFGTGGSFNFRAWDKSNTGAPDNAAAGNRFNITATGGITPFSSHEETATISVTSINDAPNVDIDNSNSDLTQNEDAGTITIPNFATNFNVGDGNTFETAAGETLQEYVVTRASGTNLVLFQGTSGRPAIDNSGTLTFTLRADRNTAGTAGPSVFDVKVVDTGSNSGSNTNFRTLSNAFSITVNSINDAPVLADQNPNRALTVDEDSTTGQDTVANIIGNSAVTEPKDLIARTEFG